MNRADRLVGSPSRASVEQFHEACLIRITLGGVAIWLDPFGMLDAKIVVNLLPKLGVGVDLVRHGNGLVKKGSAVFRGALMLGVNFYVLCYYGAIH
jgi:hypothetical protein